MPSNTWHSRNPASMEGAFLNALLATSVALITLDMVVAEFPIEIHLPHRPLILVFQPPFLGRSRLPRDNFAVVRLVHIPQGRICHLVRKGQPLRHFFSPHSLSLPGERKFATHSVSLKPIAGIARYHWRVLIASSYP